MGKIRTRFAPSPTGYMHIGNLRTALYAYLIAKGKNGDFILRIEDTDKERYVEGAVEVIYKTLKDTGLNWDEGPDIGGNYGPYIQSERKELYREYAEKLVENGEAYYCFCNKERLDTLRETYESIKKPFRYDKKCLHLSKEEIEENLKNNVPYVIRQNNPSTGSTTFEDIIYGDITVDNSELEDMILLKSDGFPTYNFANVVDDHLMEISHVVRGYEYLSSAPKYSRLYEAFGWESPIYIHVPHILKDATHKLSKRNGDASYEDLIVKGYLKEAVINYIALLGWSPGTNEEIFSLEELVKIFDFKNINKSSAIFDINKLTWLNGEYLRKMSPEEFYETSLPYLKSSIKNENIDLFQVSKLLHQRTEILSQIPEQVDFFDFLRDYDITLFDNKKMKTNSEVALNSLKASLNIISNIENWNHDEIHSVLMGLVGELQIKNGQMLWPLRCALSGKDFSPGGAIDLLNILGKEESIRRIEIGISKLES